MQVSLISTPFDFQQQAIYQSMSSKTSIKVLLIGQYSPLHPTPAQNICKLVAFPRRLLTKFHEGDSVLVRHLKIP